MLKVQQVEAILAKHLSPEIAAERAPEIERLVRERNPAAAEHSWQAWRSCIADPLFLFLRDRHGAAEAIRDEITELVEDEMWGEEASKPFIQDWIEAQDPAIDWLCGDLAYWKDLIRRARTESRMPPNFSAKSHRETYGHRTWSRRVVNAQWGSAAIGKLRGIYVLPENIVWPGPTDQAAWILRLRWIRRAIRDGLIKPELSQDPVDRYGRVVGTLLRKSMRRQHKGLDCLSHIRFCAMDSNWEVKQYERIRKAGCCGSLDEDVTILGRHFRIGCNYGH